MSTIRTNSGRKFYKKAESMSLVPYVYDDDLGDRVLGDTIYDLSAIIGDTISIDQSDGDSDSINNEFTGQPAVKNMTDGERTFSAECLDLQNAVLKSLFGAMTTTHNGYYFAAIQESAPTLYVLVRIRFRDASLPDIYLPKVLLDSKLMIGQMRSHGSQGNVQGTLFARECGVLDPTAHEDGESRFLNFSDIVGTTYIPRTPILFVPREYTPVFLHSHDSDTGEYRFTRINWDVNNGSSTTHNIVVDDASTGIYTINNQ